MVEPNPFMPTSSSTFPPEAQDSIHNPPHSAPVKASSKTSRRSQSRGRKEKYFGLIIEKDEEYFSDSFMGKEVTDDQYPNYSKISPIGRASRVE